MIVMKEIKLLNIYKSYKQKVILNDISIDFEVGKCYLILGENGSGKSTLLKIITKMIYPNKGEVKLNDNKIGYVPDKVILPLNISIKKFLYSFTLLKKSSLVKTIMLMKYFDIYEERNKLIKNLSKGMAQKILIIQAFTGDSDVLIFDEALNGLDVNMQNKLIELIKEEKSKNKIIIITSHYPYFYDQLVDVKVTISNGKIN